MSTVLVWHAWLMSGHYDIIIDTNQNGLYNAATDGIDSGSPGFVVLARPHPTPPASVPATTPPGIPLLIALLALAGVAVMRIKE